MWIADKLTDQALADRLRRIAKSPRQWRKADRDQILLEAARRIEGCRHAVFDQDTGQCAEMACWNYAGKGPRT